MFFRENKISCVVNNAKKKWIFLVRARSLAHLSDPYVFNESYMNRTSLVASTFNQAFC